MYSTHSPRHHCMSLAVSFYMLIAISVIVLQRIQREEISVLQLEENFKCCVCVCACSCVYMHVYAIRQVYRGQMHSHQLFPILKFFYRRSYNLASLLADSPQ